MTTGIEWTDETWNPLAGCSYASPGCLNCYAARETAGRLSGHDLYRGLAIRPPGKPAEFTGEVRTVPERLGQPLRWKRPRRVFVNSMSDLFHPGVPTAFIAQVYATMAVAERHTFQVLTKRPKRRRLLLRDPVFRERVHQAILDLGADPELMRWPLPNVWEGVSVEDAENRWRLTVLAQTFAAVRWVSAEPLLGGLDIEPWLHPERYANLRMEFDAENVLRSVPMGRLDWVVAGGESGPGARPMHPAWARSLRDQCAEAGVPFLFKQWGEWAPASSWPGPDHHLTIDGHLFQPGERLGMNHMAQPAAMHRWGKKAAGRLLDGITHDGYPTLAGVS